MRFLKWGFFFVLSFLVSWVLIVTFSQWQFHTGAPIRLITYSTREFPIYYYAIATFAIGLLLGLIPAVYNFVALQARLHKRDRRIHELEHELETERARRPEPQPFDSPEGETFAKPAVSAPEESPAGMEDEFLDSEGEAGGTEDGKRDDQPE